MPHYSRRVLFTLCPTSCIPYPDATHWCDTDNFLCHMCERVYQKFQNNSQHYQTCETNADELSNLANVCVCVCVCTRVCVCVSPLNQCVCVRVHGRW